MATVIAELMATLGLDASDFDKSIDKANKKGNSFGENMAGLGAIGGGILTAGIGAAVAGVSLLGVELAKDISIAMDAQKVQAQLNAVIKSTGGVANVTAEEANDLATALSKVTMFDDEAIVSGESMLLTFTNIGEEVFPKATETILDMSQALGQDLQSSAVQLGKALNDPINGATALQRVGVTFTEQQKEQIKVLQESGDMLGAQKIILDELSKEFGGSATAAGSTFAGQMTILKNTLDNIRENIGAKFLPILGELATMFSDYIMQPEVQLFIEQLATSLATFAQQAIEKIPGIIAGFKTFFDWMVNNKPIIIGILAALGVAVLAWGVTTAIAAATAIAPLLPVIAIMAAIGLAVYALAKAWETNFGGIREKTAALVSFLKQSFEGWKLFFTVLLPNAIQTLKNKWTAGFDGIRASIQRVIDFATKLKDKLMTISLPKWLTPGSPTPFEIGLWGIADALATVNKTGFNLPVPDGVNNLAAPAGVSRLNRSTAEQQEPKTTVANITINNPVGETTEKSERKNMKKLSYLGVVS